MVPQLRVQHITNWSPCAEEPDPSTVHWQSYLHLFLAQGKCWKPRYSRIYSSLDVFNLELRVFIFLTFAGFEPSTTWAPEPSLLGHYVAPLWWLLADLQNIGVDLEADVGEVLLRTDSWDVTAYLLGRWRQKKRKKYVTHFEAVKANPCTTGMFVPVFGIIHHS